MSKMSSFEKIQDRLTALQETTNQVKELIQQLATVKFQPGSVPLPKSISSSTTLNDDEDDADENNVATELTTEISQRLREEEEELELLQEEVIDMPSASPGSDAHHRKMRLNEGVQRLESEIKSCHSSFRKAQLSARNNLLAAQRLERQLLLSALSPPQPASPALSGRSSPTTATATAAAPTSPTSIPSPNLFKSHLRRHKSTKPNKENNVVNASTDVTEALRRTHNLITGELEKSAFARQTLAESTEALKELNKNYEGIDSLLSKSRTLVGTLLKSQKSDTWYLQTAFYILLCTLCWLVFRRFLYGPLWWIVWFPLRSAFRTGKLVSNSIGTGTVQESAGGARMEIVGSDGEGYRVVGVGQEGAVPTVVVGEKKKQQQKEGGDEEEEESLVDKVGRIIEDNLKDGDELELEGIRNENESDDLGGEGKEGSEEKPQGGNPMKRMWEEHFERADEQQQQPVVDPDAEAGQPGRVRDEL
ncbi:protein transport protein sec20 [Rhypophila decipiens]|uniref:Protein transport protein sec20 n=1 Tax=Rhypophila decipiens TaxID=261697 RepID=A0AAN6YJB4_9PEZI|nr:protein transport protein sec20 [Rhypophila decipiens]